MVCVRCNYKMCWCCMGDYNHKWYQPCPGIATDATTMLWLTALFITNLPLILLLGPIVATVVMSGAMFVKYLEKNKGDYSRGWVGTVEASCR